MKNKLHTTINEFKRTLIKENNINTSNIQIIVINCEYRKIKDSYTDGETDEVDSGNVSIDGIYYNLDELITALNSTLSFDISKDNIVLMDNRIIIDTLVDENDDAIELDTEEHEQWKNDEIEGFNYQLDIQIELNKIESITNSQEMSEILGIENYD